ncbi:TetR/AcrR family transcriptional regulator [uncultured Ferrimonas sp.]|uniref:TetR/AcrR family transcriptional regulator n=1 Tax=uncultured Ferrimonas sp. TaxID=432640 RepID=UPI002623033C|nr:TetR/AcrR family transcriptional regulator [uncultured Ferrimonas sp.]
MLKDQIAASLEQAFSRYGFAEPSVTQLKTACNVSLRTLYKHYPSKEAMIVAALAYRHRRYLDFLRDGAPTAGTASAMHIIHRLELWMQQYAPCGCLSLNAIAAFPDNPEITQAVHQHKQQVRQFLGQQCQQPALATTLFLLHEGISSAWPILGSEAITAAQETAVQLLGEQP